jgi:hypothetical protein
MAGHLIQSSTSICLDPFSLLNFSINLPFVGVYIYVHSVDPCYPQICDSKRTTVEEEATNAQDA